jgi:hypothetical protein
MQRSAFFPAAAALFVTVGTWLAGSSAVDATGNCMAKLVGNSYGCSIKISDGETDTACYKFVTGGVSTRFDLLLDVTDFGCACDATGSINSPSFDSSASAFECAAADTFWMVFGTVRGKQISGQELLPSGRQFVIKCTLGSPPCS